MSLPYPKQCIIVSTRLSANEKEKKDKLISKKTTSFVYLLNKPEFLNVNNTYGKVKKSYS